MKTSPILDENGKLHAFDIENLKITRKGTIKIINKIPGVKILRKPKLFSLFKQEEFFEFDLNGIQFVIWEPYGDSSTYWIGKKGGGGWCKEIETIQQAFQSAL